MGNFWKLFFTITSTNFAIFWEFFFPNFQYHKNIRKKKTKKTLTYNAKKGG
jgi:hypothetical protein